MSRSVTAGVTTELQAKTNYPIFLFEANFSSGPVRVWSGWGSITWNGQTWQGTGVLGKVDGVLEDNDITAKGFETTLTGIPSANRAIVLADARRGLYGYLYLGFTDSAFALIADPFLLAVGRLDVASISVSGDTMSIRVRWEDELIDLDRSRELLYTDVDQQALYPGDLGFNLVAMIQDRTVTWGNNVG